MRIRLERIRGVESVRLDADQGTVDIRLADENRVRLVPLISRIGQGGTKILNACVTAQGQVDGKTLLLESVNETYQLEGDAPPPGEHQVHAEISDLDNKQLRLTGSCEP